MKEEKSVNRILYDKFVTRILYDIDKPNLSCDVDTPVNNTVENHLYLLDIIKGELGITDSDVKNMSKDELKQKIRDSKMSKLLDK
jgi:hypothetical protein